MTSTFPLADSLNDLELAVAELCGFGGDPRRQLISQGNEPRQALLDIIEAVKARR